jgi:hypothetical protein
LHETMVNAKYQQCYRDSEFQKYDPFKCPAYLHG